MDGKNRRAGLARFGCDRGEVFEIKPVILGGSPTDPGNKIVLTRDEHIKTVLYWNRIIAELRARGKVTGGDSHD